MIRQPYLCPSALSQLRPKQPISLNSPSCMLLSPLEASALKSAYSFFAPSESDADDLEELEFEKQPLMMKRNVRLDYVSDYEFDEDNYSLEDYEEEDEDERSVDSQTTLHVSNRTYLKLQSPTSSATSSTVTTDDCSISSVASFDSEVAVARHHQPTPIYHHHRHSTPDVASSQLPTPSDSKAKRKSFSAVQTTSKTSSNTKKPFVRPDLMPTPLNTQSLSIPSSPPRKSPTRRRLFRNSSTRSAASVKTI